MPLSVTDFAARIKAKYPDYASMDDADLAQRIVAKHPEYASQVDMGPASMATAHLARIKAGGDVPADALQPTPDTGDGREILGQAAVQTAKDLPGVALDALKRVGSNILGAVTSQPLSMVRHAQGAGEAISGGHPLDAAYHVAALNPMMGIAADSTENALQHAQAARGAAQAGHPLEATREALQTVPVAGDVASNAVGTLTGDRKALGNLIGDVGTAALAANVPAMKSAALDTKAAKFLGDTIPPRMMNNLVPAKYFKFGAQPGEAMVGIKPDILTGVKGFEAPLEVKVNNYSRALEQVLSTPAAEARTVNLIAPIEERIAAAKQVAIDSGNEAAIARLDKLAAAQKDLAARSTADPTAAKPIEALRYKQRIGKLVKFSQDAVEGTVNDTLQEIYQGVDKQLDAAVPASKALNEKLANAITAQKMVENAKELGFELNPFKFHRVLSSPYFKSRVASGLRSMFGSEEAPLPETPAEAPTPRRLLTGRREGEGFTVEPPFAPNVPSSGVGLPRVFRPAMEDYINSIDVKAKAAARNKRYPIQTGAPQ